MIVLRDLVQCKEALLVEHEANTDTDASESARTTDTVKVCLGIRLFVISALHWYVVVDHHIDGLNIDTACKDIGRNENLDLACSELFKNPVAFSAFECTMNGYYMMAVFR